MFCKLSAVDIIPRKMKTNKKKPAPPLSAVITALNLHNIEFLVCLFFHGFDVLTCRLFNIHQIRKKKPRRFGKSG